MKNKFLFLFSSVIFFSLSFPGLLISKGFFLFAWLCYIPVFYVLKNLKVKEAFLSGLFWGFFSYSLLCFWLYKYDFACALAVCLAMSVFHALLFMIINALSKYRFSYLFQSCAFTLFEYLRSLGFLGFTYGTLGYSQYEISFIVRNADITGVYGVSFLIFLFSAFAGSFLNRLEVINVQELKKRFLELKYDFICVAPLIIIFFAAGIIRPDTPCARSIEVALIQSNSDPWKDGIEQYEKEAEHLIALTDEAFSRDENINLVVWPETAVVPDIIYHYRNGTDRRRHELARRVVSYFASKNCSFVTGNNYSKVSAGSVKSYNSALYFENGFNGRIEDIKIYNKNHLVPFSEYFPFDKILPTVYNNLVENGSHFWTPGERIEIFECGGIKFSTPVCFEDTFPQIPSKMKLAGSEMLVNLSNDSWSHSEACQRQHLAAAVFRSAENRIPSVRSTCSGQTCVIDADGRVLCELEPFSEGVLIFNVPIR